MDRSSGSIFSELEAVWQQALRVILHPGGCSCCGGQPIRLSGETIEADVFGYLRKSYESQGKEQLLDLIGQRSQMPYVSLPAWLISLSETEATAPVEICQDLINLLRTLTDHSSSRR